MVVVLRVPVEIPGYLLSSNPQPSRISLEARSRTQVRRYTAVGLHCASRAFLTSTTIRAVSCFQKRAPVASLQRWPALAFSSRKRTALDVFPRNKHVAAALLSCAIVGCILASDERRSNIARNAISACAGNIGSHVPQLLSAASVCVSFLLRAKSSPNRLSMGADKAGEPNSSAAKRPPSAEKTAENMRPGGGSQHIPTSGDGDNWLKIGHVDQRRARLLTVEVKLPQKSGGKSVVCYLQRDLRVQDNWALFLARDAAAALRLPLHVVHLLVPALGFQPTPRHLHFFYGGAHDVQRELSSLNIGFHVPLVTSSLTSGKVKEAKTKIEEIQAALQPAAVVCDFFPLRLATQVVDVLTKVCAQNQVPLYQVDAHSVVPTWVASNRLEVGARTLRPRLHLLLKEFLTPFPVLTKHPYPPLAPAAVSFSPCFRASSVRPAAAGSSSCSSLLHALPTEERLQELLHVEGPPVVEKWTPGTQAGLEQLRQFCRPQKLVNYERTRNDPLAEAQSNLSPYLHFGQLSQQRCLLEVLLVKRGAGGVESHRSSSSGTDASRSNASTHNRSSSSEADTADSNGHLATNKRDSESSGNQRASIHRRMKIEDSSSSSASSRTAAPSRRMSVRSKSSKSSKGTSSAPSSAVNRKDVITGVDAFVEEAVVRCALSENFVFYAGDKYDKLEGAPRWAQETLRQHQNDPRVPLYDLRVLEAAETYDALWNAAQQQLMREGKMHGYLRMYWAKKMLEWMKSPAEALAGAIHLNDKYSLDGTDPNGYVGCMWSIAALHDQPFRERPIYGKVRYMNYAGCQRKFNVNAFLQLYKTSSSTTSSSRSAEITGKERKGSARKQTGTGTTRRVRSSSRGEGEALGIEAKKAEKGAERLGIALLRTTFKEQQQQQGETPERGEGVAVKEELEIEDKKAKVRKRERPSKEENEEQHKQKKLRKHGEGGKKRTLQRKRENEPRQEEKKGKPRPERKAKKEQQQA